MPSRAVLPRILGALFYYSPERPEVKALFDCLPTLPELYPWRVPYLCVLWQRFERTGLLLAGVQRGHDEYLPRSLSSQYA